MVNKAHYGAILGATVSAFVVSGVWYTMFGSALAQLDAAYAETQSPPVWTLFAEFVRSLVVVCVLARLVTLIGVADWRGALRLGTWVWVLPLAILAGAVLHENLPWQLAAIHAGDWLLKLLVVTAILSTFGSAHSRRRGQARGM